MRPIAAIILILTSLFMLTPTYAQPVTPDLLVPVGGGYSDVYPGIVEAMLARASDDSVLITVLPATYSTDAESISEGERAQNMLDAETRRLELEGACQRAAPEGITCKAEIAPIFVRTDAENAANLHYFGPDVDAVFMLGGDQVIAMQVLAGTPVEDALARLHGRGGVVAGTSAGGAVLSRTMIAGYNPNFAASNALNEGSALLWQGETERGLAFGVQTAILDQHFFQRGRLGRLLEAIARPDSPHVGVGIDAYTGLRVENNTVVTDVFGLYTAAVLDAETLGAAANATYVGDQRTLSLRNVLIHLLAPGNFSYDLVQRRHSLAAPPALEDIDAGERVFERLALPEGAGMLVLHGGSARQATIDDAYKSFLVPLVSSDDPLLIVAVGYPNDKPAQRAADKLAALVQAVWPGKIETKVVASKGSDALALDKPYAGVIVVGRDQSLVDPARLQALRNAWLEGTALLLDGPAAAIAGPVFSKHGPPAEEGEQAEKDTQRSFLSGRTVITDGLNLLPVMVEPQVLETNRWGRLFSLVYHNPEQPVFAIGQDTALLITDRDPVVAGQGTVIAIDLRQAVLDLGSNEAFVVANGLLDVFAPGDRVAPKS